MVNEELGEETHMEKQKAMENKHNLYVDETVTFLDLFKNAKKID